MTLSPRVLDLIQYGPLVTVTVGHHPLSAQELREEFRLWGESPPSKTVQFLVDTGSPHNVLDQQILDDLRIEPTGAFTDIATPAGTLRECATYRVELVLLLDNGVTRLPTTVVGIPAGDLLAGPRFRGIIGRSALKRVRFVYDGAAGTFAIKIVKP